MSRVLLIISLLLFPILNFAQLSSQDEDKLRLELSKLINKLRTNKGLQPLIFNDTLKAAAKFHSDYMAKYDDLSHSQPKPKFKTPTKRVI